MILSNTFYTIELSRFDDTINQLQTTVRLNAEHPAFDGHFPGQPVVPGIFMIQMVTEILAGHLKEALMLAEIKHVKFLSVLIPGEIRELIICLDINPGESGRYAVNASVLSDGNPVMKLKGEYVPESGFSL